MTTGIEKAYNLDACALITLQTFYPLDLFPQVWEKLDDLLKEKRAYFIEEVFNEIAKRDDEIHKWLKVKKGYAMKTLTQDEFLKAQEILKTHQALVDVNAIQTAADPFVIADSLVNDSIVVTREDKVMPNAKRPKIPNVCEAYDVECIYGQHFATDFFRRNGWAFK